MPGTIDPSTLRQYARCYIMLLIGGYLMTDKLNNLVHLRWLPLLADFQMCCGLSWGSMTYYSLCSVAHRGTTDIVRCTPLIEMLTDGLDCINGRMINEVAVQLSMVLGHGGCYTRMRSTNPPDLPDKIKHSWLVTTPDISILNE
ncbi:hypothetical protein Ahy_A02g006330 [Arachis hypogaea]|uniref:Aminotransferase-like plant mobile domain-containing protein n=1 Tax=Arachis hypogaea TaxID=3818 RepID=A0A445E9J9_ARAHY|nr:hypothetical protein Ahy_A02g006330 [Arachis hypogaea]